MTPIVGGWAGTLRRAPMFRGRANVIVTTVLGSCGICTAMGNFKWASMLSLENSVWASQRFKTKVICCGGMFSVSNRRSASLAFFTAGMLRAVTRTIRAGA